MCRRRDYQLPDAGEFPSRASPRLVGKARRPAFGGTTSYATAIYATERSLHQRKLQHQRALEHREIVVGSQRQHGVALRREVGVDALHIVDLLAEISIEDRVAVDDGA